MASSISWNYTTWLDIVLLLLAAALLVRFVTTGGSAMLTMMGGSPEPHDAVDPDTSADFRGHHIGQPRQPDHRAGDPSSHPVSDQVSDQGNHSHRTEGR